MILMYHKVAMETPTMWWVSVSAFYRQMCELRGFEVVCLDEYDPDNPRHRCITFDGVYENIHQFAAPILAEFGYPFELFVVEDLIGQHNEFDREEPLARFASWAQLGAMARMGGRIQFHTKTHPRLDGGLTEARLAEELSPGERLRTIGQGACRWFAYPHGALTPEVVAAVRTRFHGAVSCHQGDERDRHQLNRFTVVENTRLASRTVGVLIPCYNYGSFLGESVESVLRQTLPADRIVILDDGSTDSTEEIGRALVARFPANLEFVRNEKNLGIVRNFNKGVELLRTDYLCLIGADNRIPSRYLEACTRILDRFPRCGAAYTDFMLFGDRAEIVAERFPVPWRAGKHGEVFWKVCFPEPSGQKAIDLIRMSNFVHGSSMFRRTAFDEVGGYREVGNQPEDQNLFRRMLEAGWEAKKAPTFLEYRQHSAEQANIRLDLARELQLFRRLARERARQIEKLEAEITDLKQRPWKLVIRLLQRAVETGRSEGLAGVWHRACRRLKRS